MWRGRRWPPHPPVVAAVVLLGLVAALITGFPWVRRSNGPGSGAPAGQAAAPVRSASPPASAAASPASTPGPTLPPGPAHFATLPPGAVLPSSARCAAWVRAQPYPENKRVNRPSNLVIGHHLGAGFFGDRDESAQIAARVDGAFTGTTREILRWAACKWGVDEDIVYAQAAQESWWRQTSLGDFRMDASACAPGHGLGADGQPGQCPQSFGILQNRFPYERSSWPGIATSTAMNADTAFAIWRGCYEGFETWLDGLDRGRQYLPGDAWGCIGRWYAGRWHTAGADRYAASVQAYMGRRIWEQPEFQEP